MCMCMCRCIYACVRVGQICEVRERCQSTKTILDRFQRVFSRAVYGFRFSVTVIAYSIDFRGGDQSPDGESDIERCRRPRSRRRGAGMRMAMGAGRGRASRSVGRDTHLHVWLQAGPKRTTRQNKRHKNMLAHSTPDPHASTTRITTRPRTPPRAITTRHAISGPRCREHVPRTGNRTWA